MFPGFVPTKTLALFTTHVCRLTSRVSRLTIDHIMNRSLHHSEYFSNCSANSRSLLSRGTLFCPPSLPMDFI